MFHMVDIFNPIFFLNIRTIIKNVFKRSSTDMDREWAYDRESHIGKLDAALDIAEENDLIVIDMKNDWNQIYPPVAKD